MTRVLVVDNDRLFRNYLRDLLSRDGHRVRTAHDGIGALDTLASFTPDVIFIDLIMPNISGDHLCRIIRKIPRLQHTYRVILSAVAAEEKLARFTEWGAHACIAKGPLSTMGRHIAAAMRRATTPPHAAEHEIIGLDHVHPRQVTRELISLSRHLGIVLDQMREGIFELTGDRRVVYANPAAAALAQLPLESLLACPFLQLFEAEQRPDVAALLGRPDHPYSGGDENPHFRMGRRQVELTVLPLPGRSSQTIVISHDVTEKLQREAQLREAQKSQAIETLAAGIAHDFNNLLMGIQGNVSLLLLQAPAGTSSFKRLKKIEQQVDSGSRLSDQLLGYARRRRLEFKPLDLNRLLRQRCSVFEDENPRITIRLSLAQDLRLILADATQLEQALLNLCNNAAEAMPSGGELHIRTANASRRQLAHTIYNPPSLYYAEISIADTGAGIDRQARLRIFDPFYTTKAMGRGTGLGLASVYGIVKAHKGYIQVESQTGRGTTLRVYLPAEV